MRKFSLLFAFSLLLSFTLVSSSLARFSQQREENAERLYNEAIRYEKNGRFQEAIESAKSIINDYPSPRYVPNTLLLLGLCYENTYEFKKAIRYYRKVMHGYSSYRIAKIARYKNDLIGKSYRTEKKPLIIFIQQERLIRDKKYEESIRKCRKIIKQFPRSNLADNAQNTIGYIYLNYLKKYEKAKQAYQTLLEVYSDSSFQDNATFAIGRCFERLELYQSSLHTYNKLLKKHKGLIFAKTNYWSRVWTTKAEDRIEKVQKKIEDLEEDEGPLAKFVKPAQEVCVGGEQTEDHQVYPITKWVDPKEAGRYLGSKIKQEKTAFFFSDDEKNTLNVWNYINNNFDLIRDPIEKEWQFPEETASLKSGTDRDLSFLLASLLIHLEIDPENVKVVYGKDKENNIHWWVWVKVGGTDYNLTMNLNKERLEELFPAKYERYLPELAFNNSGATVKPGIPVPFTTCD